MPEIAYRYGKTVVHVHDGWLDTVLPDGTHVQAVPDGSGEDFARARALGYGGADPVWQMTLDHDRLHAGIAQLLGLPESPALRASAVGAGPSELTGLEEDAVLSVQRLLNACRRAGLTCR